MTVNVWLVSPRGVETLRENLSESEADAFVLAMRRHPSCHGSTLAVLPTFCDAPGAV